LSVGLCSEAVAAFEKAGDSKAAIDCCVQLNQWSQAVELAQRYKFPQIEGLLTKYAQHLLQKDELFSVRRKKKK
jgi:WD repeat-containing protein 35